MDIEGCREYCISKKGVTEELPFDNVALVFKVLGKMFALTDLDQFESINLKCDPNQALQLREKYPAVQPGYHMNKQHWNTVIMDGSITNPLIKQWIDDSYNLVVTKLPKPLQEELAQL